MAHDLGEGNGPLHRQRGIAESFGSDPERYDRSRSGCPQALLDRLLSLTGACKVLDVGCGTGIVARQFAGLGCHVTGVEPDVRMAEFARSAGVRVDISTFEAWGPAGRLFDLVVSSAAWHWIDPFAGAVKAAEALATGGWLTPFWHTYQLPAQVGHAYERAMRRVAPDSALTPWLGQDKQAAYQQVFDTVSDAIVRTGQFHQPSRWRIDWETTYTRDDWLNRMPTQGTLGDLPTDDRLDVLTCVGAAIDDIGGQFTLNYSTVVIAAQRVGRHVSVGASPAIPRALAT